ncbi:MAG: linear amide C-N hydrolase [Chloroflexi bacterium]|nr:linear amide C-N hydrolase [Chloroflexota bacterium]
MKHPATRRIAEIVVILIAVTLLYAVSATIASACSDIQFTDDKDFVVSARTMDFDIDLKSDIKIVPRGQPTTSNASDGKKGLSWTSKYGFVGVNALDLDKFNDGLNEKGLSVGMLWLELSEYPNPTSSDNALSIQDVGTWMLGNFATVNEVKTALKNVTVWGEMSNEIKMVPPVHFSIHDAQGNNLVVEFVKGEMKIYDNPNGVMVNDPTLDWHLTSYKAFKGNRLEVGAAPSGLYSPSRFIALSRLRDDLVKPKTNREALEFAMAIIGRVSFIPGEGVEVKTDAQAQDALMPYGGTYTQWTVIRDHKNLVYFYKTTLNSSYRLIDLKKVDFSAGQAIKALNLENDNADLAQDMTSKFK